jgi:NAD(P)-dependent dehydrogenase (short-subunit alcohol dehydrogenase family)
MNIEDKTVLVTGSTDGVGRLVARRLADRGARVLIHGRDRARGEQLLDEIRAAKRGSAAFLPAVLARGGASPRRRRPPGL